MSTGPAGKRQATREAGERRAKLLTELQRAAQRSTTDGILFHQAVADRLGLHVTDLRCLNLLSLSGPLTAGELGQQTGLGTTGAVTRMVDRLERAGYVRRQRDASDRRKVVVAPMPEAMAELAQHYAEKGRHVDAVLRRRDPAQLRVIAEFLDELTSAPGGDRPDPA
jgi:DNA-binding MarR family transcriptional regulator